MGNKQIKFPSLLISRTSELVQKKMTDTILSGKLEVGDKLPTEKEMADQFGVSLVTLREALSNLEMIGFIKKRKGRGGGNFISHIDSNSIKISLGNFLGFKKLSIKHLYEVRKIIEPPMVKLAVQNITPDELRNLEENIAYCESRLKESGPSFNEKDFFDVDQKNVDFHRLLGVSTHNPVLSLTLDYVFDFLVQTERELMVPDVKFSIDTVKEHRSILKFLKQKDGEKCEREMIEHLKDLDQYLENIEELLLNRLVSPQKNKSLE
jgi:GntR family transcriptional repressor for pyruvate dehydrogenase complex